MIQRHSSRRNRLDRAVLNQRLDGAVAYDRIAGYFRSSLFEVAGEAWRKSPDRYASSAIRTSIRRT